MTEVEQVQRLIYCDGHQKDDRYECSSYIEADDSVGIEGWTECVECGRHYCPKHSFKECPTDPSHTFLKHYGSSEVDFLKEGDSNN